MAWSLSNQGVLVLTRETVECAMWEIMSHPKCIEFPFDVEDALRAGEITWEALMRDVHLPSETYYPSHMRSE
jgi:hypothetical protein